MVSWAAVGETTNGFGGMRQIGLDFGYFPYSYYFASPGSVDAQAVVRAGLRVNLPSSFEGPTGLGMENGFNAIVRISFVAGDFAAHPGKRLTASMFMCEADDFAAGVIPTPSQIIAAPSTTVYRPNGYEDVYNGAGATDLYATVAGTYDFVIAGLQPEDLALNTKYWVLVIPTAHTAATSPSVANDAPVSTVPTDDLGRAISAWSDRTPAAPVITSPPAGTIVGPGAFLDFAFAPKDPDAFINTPDDYHPNAVADLAGVQVQYAPQPTDEEPSPTWADLPIYTQYVPGGPISLGAGWFIEGSDETGYMDKHPHLAGAGALRQNRTMRIRVGDDTPFSNSGDFHGVLPTGDWQVRMRTFSYGHQFPTVFLSGYAPGAGPLGSIGEYFSTYANDGGPWADTDYNPDNYPAEFTSPWSTALSISVSEQVPPPELVSPIENVAIADGLSVTLRWNYKNTAHRLNSMVLAEEVPIGATTEIIVQGMQEDMPAGMPLKLSNGQIAYTSAPVSWGAGVTIPIDSLNVTSVLAYGAAVRTLPYPQKTRTIQMREATTDTWTDVLVADADDATSWLVTGFTLEATTQYEWRVKVTDLADVESEYSEIGVFWIIPAPSSGAVRPDPSETVDGATLGCGTHRAFIFRRGGLERVGEITGLSYLDWGRTRDDISTAKIEVVDWDIDCGNLLSKLHCWAYELVIFRNNGFSEDRVWEGPLTLITYTETKVTIEAKDVMGYAYRRIIKDRMSDAADGDTVVNRAARILQNVFAPDDPNVLAYLDVVVHDDDAMQYRTTPAYSRTAFEEVDDMAANSGLDYTAIGRSIIVWSTKHRLGTLPEFRDNDLGANPIVSEYGMSMANRYVVSDGNGIWGEATRLDVSGNDETYGLVEMLSSSWASDSTEDTGTYTEAGRQTVIDSFEVYSERGIADRYPNPVVVRIPDNTSINPDALVSIQQLVPGVVIPLRSFGTLRTVVGNQKLDSLKVVDTGGNETVSITLSPFNRDDEPEEEA